MPTPDGYSGEDGSIEHSLWIVERLRQLLDDGPEIEGHPRWAERLGCWLGSLSRSWDGQSLDASWSIRDHFGPPPRDLEDAVLAARRTQYATSLRAARKAETDVRRAASRLLTWVEGKDKRRRGEPGMSVAEANVVAQRLMQAMELDQVLALSQRELANRIGCSQPTYRKTAVCKALHKRRLMRRGALFTSGMVEERHMPPARHRGVDDTDELLDDAGGDE